MGALKRALGALVASCAVASICAFSAAPRLAGGPGAFPARHATAGLTRHGGAGLGSWGVVHPAGMGLKTSRVRRTASPSLAPMCMTAQAEETAAEEDSLVNDDERLMGSRRLAAASKVLKEGAKDTEHGKLLGSKRLSVASEILIKTPRDKDRILGSKRLRQAREILFRGASGELSDTKMFGSKRLSRAKNILTRGIRPMEPAEEAMQAVEGQAVLQPRPPTPEPETLVDAEGVRSGRIGSSVYVQAQPKGPLQFGNAIATETEIAQVAAVRKQIAEIPAAERAKMTDWVDNLLDVDIFRYVHQFKRQAFEKIKATAVFRKEEGIDNILETDAVKFENYFEQGNEEIVYLAPDKQGRPILLYRSAYHKVGRFEPKEYTRYILYQTEKTRLRNGLGITRQSCVLVDRVGSGGKNQDPALLKVLLPTVLNHYPMYIGNVYIAPISTVFFLVWKIIQLLLDEDTKKRFFLLGNDYTDKLLEIVEKDALPSTLGGDLDVPDFCAKMRNLDKAEEQLAELEEQMEFFEGVGGMRELQFDGKTGTEEEIMRLAEMRVNIASLAPEEQKKYGGWLQALENVDLLRFLRVHQTVDKAWAALLTTAQWREDNKINTILDEDLSGTFAEGKTEVYLLPPDKQGRPVFVYRSANHLPGTVSNKDFIRYTLQVVEKARIDYGVGIKTPVCILVDRVGSGKKNQDIGLLQELLPTLQTHYPQTVGAIYIAPINWVFFLIWQLASLLFDEDTAKRVVLVKGDIETELLKAIPADVLPKNMGGQRAIPEAGVV